MTTPKLAVSTFCTPIPLASAAIGAGHVSSKLPSTDASLIAMAIVIGLPALILAIGLPTLWLRQRRKRKEVQYQQLPTTSRPAVTTADMFRVSLLRRPYGSEAGEENEDAGSALDHPLFAQAPQQEFCPPPTLYSSYRPSRAHDTLSKSSRHIRAHSAPPTSPAESSPVDTRNSSSGPAAMDPSRQLFLLPLTTCHSSDKTAEPDESNCPSKSREMISRTRPPRQLRDSSRVARMSTVSGTGIDHDPHPAIRSTGAEGWQPKPRFGGPFARKPVPVLVCADSPRPQKQFKAHSHSPV